MFHLLIVEDEKHTREGLRRHINWEEIDIGRVTAVASGKAALEAAQAVAPDILLSDIRMPHMTGIELASKIREVNPKCKIIFLSGYADKEYLISAIELKAMNYLEKPVDLEELKKTVRNAVDQLRSELQEELIHNSYQLTLSMVRDEIVMSLLDPELDWKQFEKNFIPLYFSWGKVGSYNLICIRTVCRTEILQDGEDWAERITQKLFSMGSLSPGNCLYGKIDEREVILIVNDVSLSTVRADLGRIQEFIQTEWGCDSTIGISGTLHSLMRISEVGKMIRQLTAYEEFYYEKQCIYDFRVPLQVKPLPVEIFSLSEFNRIGAEKLFQLLEGEKFTDIAAIRRELYKLYLIMAEKSWNDHILSWDAFSCCTLTEYRELLYDELNTFQLLGSDNYDVKIKKTIHYILWNYTMPDLSIKKIAEHVGLSQNYLSSLFKNQTGMTINDFLNNIRVERAGKLLRKTDLKLYEIAEKVGLSDPNYMSTVFKKRYGVSPMAYRKSGKGT